MEGLIIQSFYSFSSTTQYLPNSFIKSHLSLSFLPMLCSPSSCILPLLIPLLMFINLTTSFPLHQTTTVSPAAGSLNSFTLPIKLFPPKLLSLLMYFYLHSTPIPPSLLIPSPAFSLLKAASNTYVQVVIVSSLIGRPWFAFSAAEVEAAATTTAEVAACDKTTEEEQGL